MKPDSKGATRRAKLLIADDEAAITAGLGAILEDEGYEVEVVGDGQTALDRLATESFGVVLADLQMPKLDGLGLLKELQARSIPTSCIIVTGQGTIGSAVEAMREGAYDYIQKPLNAENLNRLKAILPKAIDRFLLEQKNRELSTKLENLTHYGELTGQSESMRQVYDIIDKVAPSTASVLILGESGTGKELVARALHSKSERAKGPFFALNCAALPKEILENELFGHEKGAFTGSTNEKPGAFEMASTGTIFLDEVAEMSPDIQVKLLRALESRMVRRLGGKKEIPVDIRIVAATNKDLQKAIEEGELREDLYYRLAVVELDLPPLRERLGDVQLLAEEFLARFSSQNGKKLQGFDETSLQWINSHQWPGNVRELKNAVESAVIMARGPLITPEDIVPRRLRNSGEFNNTISIPVGSTLAEARRQLVLRTFASTGGDAERSATMIGMPIGDLRAELASIFGNANGSRPAAHDDEGAAEAPVSRAKAAPRSSKQPPAKPAAKRTR
jgi:DNA-binding NtrC family response regulator